MVNKKYLIKSFLSGRNNAYSYVSKKDVEVLFEEIVNKLVNQEKLDEDENNFLNLYMIDYYKSVGGSLYPYPNYEEKLKPIYEKLVRYYINNVNNNNRESITFLMYYFLTSMCKDTGIKPMIYLDDKEYFSKNPNAGAYHSNDSYNGAPIVCFNPTGIERVVKDKNRLFEFLTFGFHELEHEVQHMQVSDENIKNPQSLIWGKEFLVRKVIGNIYYNYNYHDIFHERDARDYSYRRLLSEMTRFGRDDISISEDASYNPNIKHHDVENDNDVMAIDLLDAITCEYVSSYPYLLNSFPVLKNIYDSNGTKKLLSQIRYELYKKRDKEVNKEPSKKKEITQKYERLLYGICETDNDLKMQWLCENAYYCAEDNDEIGLRTKVNLIKKLMHERNISYEDVMKRFSDRILFLQSKLNNKKLLQSDEIAKYRAELAETRRLKESVLKYNEIFSKKFNDEKIIKQLESGIRQATRMNLSTDKYIAGSKHIYLETKTVDELTAEYQEIVKRVKENVKDENLLEQYLDYLRKMFWEYKKQISSSKSVPGRKF